MLIPFLGQITLPFASNDWARDIVVDPTTNRLYVTSWYGQGVWVLDGSNLSVIAKISTNADAYFLALNPDNDRLYVSNYTSQSVSVIDVMPGSPTENNVLATIPVGPASLDIDRLFGRAGLRAFESAVHRQAHRRIEVV